MPVKPIPDGYHTVTPYLIVREAARALVFYAKAFGAKELFRLPGPDGKIMHAELRIDDTVVMIAEAGGNYPAFPVWLHVYVQDVDATYRKALDAGGVSVQEPVRKEGDPDRRGGFKDPSGNTWWIATQMG